MFKKSKGNAISTIGESKFSNDILRNWFLSFAFLCNGFIARQSFSPRIATSYSREALGSLPSD